MSDTPRTDEAEKNGYHYAMENMASKLVLSDFARQLERELASERSAKEQAISERNHIRLSLLREMTPKMDAMKSALESMTRQFAYWSNSAGGYTTGGLSALESAFDALGWDDPHPAPEARCDEPGCMEQISCGTPTPTGYRYTCRKHAPKITVDK